MKRGCRYDKHLRRYFDEQYSEYDDYVEWFADPHPNHWKFRIPDNNVEVELICDDEGNVTEKRSVIDK